MGEVNRADAEAASAKDIEYAKQKQAIVEAMATRRLREEEVMLKVKDVELQQAVNVARREAEALKLQADIIKMKGDAANEILQQRAEIYKEFGHDAIVQNVVEMLPGLAREIAQPLGKTEKMIFVSSDGSSASNLSKDIIKAAAQ